jgi:hypothetical protein
MPVVNQPVRGSDESKGAGNAGEPSDRNDQPFGKRQAQNAEGKYGCSRADNAQAAARPDGKKTESQGSDEIPGVIGRSRIGAGLHRQLALGHHQRIKARIGKAAETHADDEHQCGGKCGQLFPAVRRHTRFALFYFISGMTNSAPSLTPEGQRDVTVFVLV